MTWQLFDIEILGNQAQVLLDDQYVADNPGAELPNIAWFGVWCQQDTGGHYWNPEETDKLNQIEQQLLDLAGQYGNGWAVYVRRVISAGKREYFFYFGEDASLVNVLAELKMLYPEYRIEYDVKPDLDWSHYSSWLKEAPNA
jgi:hypothetical protein